MVPKEDLLAGRISAGDLSAFVFYAFLVASATGALSELSGDLQRAAGAAERIAALLKADQHLEIAANPVSLEKTKALTVDFRSVDFSYQSRPDMPAVKSVNLSFAAGQRVALVGPSGAGKSTLFHLLLRLYDPESGHIKFNDTDIKNLTLENLRSRISLVPQDPALFSTSIYDNLVFGRPEASYDEVVEAAKQAAAHEFIMSLPEGYNAIVGEKGVRLSGGQKQRLAIARALLRDPALLLLDEATSALDSVNEAAVQQSLGRLMRGRTTLVIAHRLSTVTDADMIVLMDHGQVVDMGDHEALLARSELYQELVAHQFGPR